jgi:phospholipase D1/2
MKSKKKICITGWMITPYFLLKRPGSIKSSPYRLDKVLKKAAERGVKIYIIPFR